jgi:hypothetical protein
MVSVAGSLAMKAISFLMELRLFAERGKPIGKRAHLPFLAAAIVAQALAGSVGFTAGTKGALLPVGWAVMGAETGLLSKIFRSAGALRGDHHPLSGRYVESQVGQGMNPFWALPKVARASSYPFFPYPRLTKHDQKERLTGGQFDARTASLKPVSEESLTLV